MMDSHKEIISKMQSVLEPLSYVHAMWLEGSVPQGYGDQYSDIDVWLEVDLDKMDKTYEIVKNSLNSIGPIDLEYEVYKDNDQRHIIYHIEGMSEFLTIDVNVQPFPGKSGFDKGIDVVSIVFNKDAELRFYDPKPEPFDEAASKKRLLDYYRAMRPNVLKNVYRDKPVEAKIYYNYIVEMAVKYLRRKRKLDVKLDYNYKHLHRDLGQANALAIEKFVFIKQPEIQESLDELGEWLKTL